MKPTEDWPAYPGHGITNRCFFCNARGCDGDWCVCNFPVPEDDGFSFKGTWILHPNVTTDMFQFVNPVVYYGEAFTSWAAGVGKKYLTATTKIFTVSHLPPELIHDWMQHLRDFDTAHPGCHFETMVDTPDKSITEIAEIMRVNPGLTFGTYFKRKKEPGDEEKK